MSGHIGSRLVPDAPDRELVAALTARLDCPIVAKRRYATYEHLRRVPGGGA